MAVKRGGRATGRGRESGERVGRSVGRSVEEEEEGKRLFLFFVGRVCMPFVVTLVAPKGRGAREPGQGRNLESWGMGAVGLE